MSVESDDVVNTHIHKLLQGQGTVERFTAGTLVLAALIQERHNNSDSLCFSTYGSNNTFQVLEMVIRGHVVGITAVSYTHLLGGDEFAMFMTGMVEQKAAERFFERLFQNIRQIDLAEMQGKKIEMSLGACFYDGDENVSFDELYRNADSAMYQSKKKQGYSYTIYDGQ